MSNSMPYKYIQGVCDIYSKAGSLILSLQLYFTIPIKGTEKQVYVMSIIGFRALIVILTSSVKKRKQGTSLMVETHTKSENKTKNTLEKLLLLLCSLIIQVIFFFFRAALCLS